MEDLSSQIITLITIVTQVNKNYPHTATYNAANPFKRKDATNRQCPFFIEIINQIVIFCNNVLTNYIVTVMIN